MSAPIDAAIAEAAELVRSADAILIGAGAGMGVDSGLPDFRGPEGFWQAYPAFQGLDSKRFRIRIGSTPTPEWRGGSSATA